MTMPTPELSVVILCYKTGESIRPFIQKLIETLQPHVGNYELILVGNYIEGDTTDRTPQIVKDIAAKNNKIKYTAIPKKGMMGWDVRTGLALATGKYIAFIDGDGQMPVDDIVRVYQKMIEGGYDFVKTYRTQREDGSFRKVNSLVYNALFSVLFPGYPNKDVNAKPKIFSRSFYNKLKLQSDDWFLDAEIMIQARRYHAKLAEIPTVFFEVTGRKSFVRVKHVLEFLKNFLRARVHEFFISQ